MLKHLHLTDRQWRGILRWSLYGLVFLAVLLAQTILGGHKPLFGVKLSLIPSVITVICILEGPEKGGVFAIVTALIWGLSGTEYGNLSIAVIPVGAILSAVLCRSVLTLRLLPTLLCCLGVTLANSLLIFAFRLIIPPQISPDNLWRVLLPSVGLSMAIVPLVYPLAKKIGRLRKEE